MMDDSSDVENKINSRKRGLAEANIGENNDFTDDNTEPPEVKFRKTNVRFIKTQINDQNNLNNGTCTASGSQTLKSDNNQSSCINTNGLELNHIEDDEASISSTSRSFIANSQTPLNNSCNKIQQDDERKKEELCKTNDGSDYNQSYLTNCCEEVVVDILKYLSTSDLMSVMKTCTRLERITHDKRLWRFVSLLTCSNTYDELLNILKLCNGMTKELRLRGLDEALPQTARNKKIIKNFTAKLQKEITNWHQLTALELYGIQFDMKALKISDLPSQLKCLVLCGCQMSNTPSYRKVSWLQGMNIHLIHLEILRIEYCTWLYPDDLMTLSKIPELHTLSLRGCVSCFDIVAYGSISTLHGFTKLKFLDLRHVPLRDSDLQCFNSVRSLREIKLECYPFIEDEGSIYHQLMIDVNDDTIIPIQCPPLQPIRSSICHFSGPPHVICVDIGTPRTRSVANAQNAPIAPNRIHLPSRHELENALQCADTLNNNIITNLGVCSFGSPSRQVHPHRIWISVRQRPRDTLIERFTVRNYKNVTDIFLTHLEQCAPNITYLDIRGTGCTADGIAHFRNINPHCIVISDHF